VPSHRATSSSQSNGTLRLAKREIASEKTSHLASDNFPAADTWRKGVQVKGKGKVHPIRNRRQRTDIGKYSIVNRTIRLWNRLPAKILETLPCKTNALRKRVRSVINVVN
jgi:hypothetical protein